MKQKTYRVPKRVSDNAKTALALLDHIDLKQGDGVVIAQALASGMPVGPNVLRAIDAYFASQGRADVPGGLMYGGVVGRQWANRCVTLSIAPTKVHETEETVEEIFDVTDEEFEALHEFAETLKTAVAESEEKSTEEPAEGDTELGVKDPVIVVTGVPDEVEDVVVEDEPVDELEEHIETALGLATKLDETIEKLAVALDEALEETEDEELLEPVDPEVEEFERRMVQDALAEIDVEDLNSDEWSVAAAEARERMSNAMLVRERSLAMSKMASARMGLKTTAAAEEPVPPAEPKGPARARLEKPLPPIENPAGRLEAYRQWAEYQMAPVTAALGREEDAAAPTEPQGTGQPADPYFVAEVDPIDPTAVLGLYAFIPADDPTQIQCFIRADATWVPDPEFLMDLQSTTPPTVVELDYDTLLSVIEQIDAYDLANPD